MLRCSEAANVCSLLILLNHGPLNGGVLFSLPVKICEIIDSFLQKKDITCFRKNI